MKLILMTGAAGGVAGMIRPLMRADYRLRLSDRRPIPERTDGAEEVTADLGDMAALRHAVAGVDAIVHEFNANWIAREAGNIFGAKDVRFRSRSDAARPFIRELVQRDDWP